VISWGLPVGMFVMALGLSGCNETLTLPNANDWTCTQTVVVHHPAHKRNIKLGGGFYEAYDSTMCTQYTYAAQRSESQ
jgi:hypothetical protein